MSIIIPVRCFTCGKLISDKWDEFKKRVIKQNENPNRVLNDLEIKRYCCRRMFISHVTVDKEARELIDEILKF